MTRFDVAGAEGYMTASTYPDDGVGEVFLKLGKQGSTLAGVMDAFSMAISVGLQYGIPLESYVAKFTNLRFEPAGMTDDPDIRIATSMMDYIFRRLALDHLPYERRAELGILSAAERAAELAGQDPATLGVEVDPVTLAQSFGGESRHRASAVPAAAARRPGSGARRGHGRAARRPALHRRADRVPAGPHGGRPAVPDLRNEDAPGRQLLRLRGLRLHQRLQLKRLLIRKNPSSGRMRLMGCIRPERVCSPAQLPRAARGRLKPPPVAVELPGLDECARRNSARAVIAAVLAIELFALAAQPTLASDGVAVPGPVAVVLVNRGSRHCAPQPITSPASRVTSGSATMPYSAVVRNALARMTPQRACRPGRSSASDSPKRLIRPPSKLIDADIGSFLLHRPDPLHRLRRSLRRPGMSHT